MNVKKHTWKTYAFWIILAEAVGFLAGWLTRKGTKAYEAAEQKPPLTPPGVVFPIVWTILFALMGIGAARIWRAPKSKERTRGIKLFGVQLAVNFFWSILFFGLQTFALAFWWLVLLWGLILAMIRTFAKVDRVAAWLQVPYLIWVTFAGYLNAGVWFLNR